MIRFSFFFLFFYLVFGCNAQCVLSIKQIGLKADTVPDVVVANYQEIKPIRLNDSVIEYVYSPVQPENLFIIIDFETRWSTHVWINPQMKRRELVIDYSKHTAILKDPSDWDIITSKTDSLDMMGNFVEEEAIIIPYIKQNPSSYLSLWFFTHSHGIYIKPTHEKLSLFKTLSSELQKYQEYKQINSDLTGRRYPNIGDSFKEFELGNIEDSIFNTNSIKDKWILLHFWSTNCGPCIKEMDEFVHLYNSIDKSKISFISISLDENKEKWQKSKVSNKIIWTSLWQPDGFYGDLCLNYNVYSMPFFILFDKEKKLVFIKDGANELENIKNTLKEIK